MRAFQKDSSTNPGPGDYKKSRRSHSPIAIKGSQTFSKEERADIKIYQPEYEKDFKNRLGPGPGLYETVSAFKKVRTSSKTSFPKAVRELSEVKRGQPGPGEYNTDMKRWKMAMSMVQEQPKAVIPKAYKNFDIIKYGSTSNEIILKGIY